MVVVFLASGWTPRCKLIRPDESAESTSAPPASLAQGWEHAQALIFNTLERFPDAFEAVRLALNRALDAALGHPQDLRSP
jgi:hypothetical protein